MNCLPQVIEVVVRADMLVDVDKQKAFRTVPDIYQTFQECYIKNIF